MSENWKIQVSPKLPDGTLVNIRAESAEELTSLLNYAGQNAQLITDTAALLIGARNAAAVTQPQSQGVPQTQQPGFSPQPQTQSFQAPGQPAGVLQFPQQGQAQPPVSQQNGGPTCAHGPYVWKDFVSKKGNAVKGWFCPSQSRTDCPPDFKK